MTGLILKISGIENADAVEFYTEKERSIRLKKDELVRVYRNNTVEYYALIDANKLGRGHLISSVEFTDCEVEWNRPVVVSGFTGYSIPCMGDGNTISCGDYEVTFERVSNIPKNEGTHIYIGVVPDMVVAYNFITETMIKRLDKLDVEPMEYSISVKPGDRLVVAIPYDQSLKAYKDNGFGQAVSFGNSVMSANADFELRVDDIKYKICGEFNAVEYNAKIYIR